MVLFKRGQMRGAGENRSFGFVQDRLEAYLPIRCSEVIEACMMDVGPHHEWCAGTMARTKAQRSRWAFFNRLVKPNHYFPGPCRSMLPLDGGVKTGLCNTYRNRTSRLQAPSTGALIRARIFHSPARFSKTSFGISTP